MRNLCPLFYLKGQSLRREPELQATFAIDVERPGFLVSLDKIYYLKR